MKYYLDTAIWIDMHENRSDKFRPLGEWAFVLLRKIRKEKHTVVYSDILIDELLRKYTDTDDIFRIASESMEKTSTKKEQAKEAARLCKHLKIPFADCLHAILARDSGAVMVTRDRHFEQLQFIVKSRKPEELI
ncbi:PIN domain-containing protein [Candidatus Woesearchaeota archaeon]|nr:PIN domain-containing protein [Candidatus Woesearchaeota archaeon]